MLTDLWHIMKVVNIQANYILFCWPEKIDRFSSLIFQVRRYFNVANLRHYCHCIPSAEYKISNFNYRFFSLLLRFMLQIISIVCKFQNQMHVCEMLTSSNWQRINDDWNDCITIVIFVVVPLTYSWKSCQKKLNRKQQQQQQNRNFRANILIF